jgi:phosphoglycerate dehydrogenase-like enzyme
MRPRVFVTRLIPEEGLQRVRECAQAEVWPEELPPSRAALRGALAAGRIFHVALDVTDPEPIPAGDPLLASDNATVVPHIGSASFATRARMAVLAADNLIAALHGDRPPHPVNPEILERRT